MLEHVNSDHETKLAYRKSGPPEVLLEIQRDMNAIASEYTSCLESSSTLFGQKTLKAADALKNANSYDPNDSKQQAMYAALFSSMVEEATYFPSKIAD